MVEEQIIRRGVVDVAVLDAMRAVPRHLYMPPVLIEVAYDDSPQSIGYGQTISQPYIVASMTEQLGLTKDSRVLEIGTGSGYQTAVLAEIAREVLTIELIPELAASASNILNRFYPHRVKMRVGDGHDGWQEGASFDGIIVTAAADEIPAQLVNQMNVNGRMIIPVRSVRSDLQELVLAIRTAAGVTCEVLYQVRFVPLRRG
ncbi:MAG: protein-L-isoaspartate(D-aspartate) O-methyltransferase [bacterium]|nr:protein-L-isoaspartate(D-aspartate) O-methyltransferase [bacterium]